MLDRRRRRWADVVQTVYKCFVFAGLVVYVHAPDAAGDPASGNPWSAELICKKNIATKGFFSIRKHHKCLKLALSASFEYLC